MAHKHFIIIITVRYFNPTVIFINPGKKGRAFVEFDTIVID